MTSTIPTTAANTIVAAGTIGNASGLSASQENRHADSHAAAHSVPSPPSGRQFGSQYSKPIAGLKTSADIEGSHESVSRLISETAHDLRAPLSTIREAVRLVRDGDLGQVSTAQRECLSAAINQCNCAVQLVDEMVQSRQFDSGFPNVQREWVLIDQLRQNVESTLQPWMMPRDIHLLWDGPFDQGARIYADANLMRRLIVNLVGNAIRVTRDGGPVLIRAKTVRGQDSMVWSVVDQGQGIAPSDMELIAAGKAPARSTGGLGLMISRQLAAAHFSTLRIESRVGTGTAVSFRTPTGGPAAVATRWVDWRSDLLSMGDGAVQVDRQLVHEVLPARPSKNASKPTPPRRVRIDVPAQVIELGAGEIQPAFENEVFLTTVAVGAAIPASGTDAFDAILQRSMRMTELAYRTGRRSWVIAWDADREMGNVKRMELQRLVRNELDGIRMTWGQSSVVSVRRQPYFGVSLPVRLTELIVRETLSAAQHSVNDADQVRLGTAPIVYSPLPASRLEKEVMWLHENRR
ncbi:MAG: HAMP domain-containing histidine kinase [Planctomycetales bacterium]|nr:HAMP domain-containing histidine kinase [Planctomycetales bacterium]